MPSLRQARNRRKAARSPASASGASASLTLRLATPEDHPRIARLAALDSSRPPEPPVLAAELDGELSVAVSLTDLHTVADPFRFTMQVRAITLARARQLLEGGVPEGRRWWRFGVRGTAEPSRRTQGAT
jgi:hypothetical protein